MSRIDAILSLHMKATPSGTDNSSGVGDEALRENLHCVADNRQKKMNKIALS